MPGWLAGLTGEGLALRDAGSPVPGYLTLGAAGAAFVALIIHASTRRPGGPPAAGMPNRNFGPPKKKTTSSEKRWEAKERGPRRPGPAE